MTAPDLLARIDAELAYQPTGDWKDWVTHGTVRDALLRECRERIAELNGALDELVDHHCGGVCSETEAARGYRPHSEVMAIVSEAQRGL